MTRIAFASCMCTQVFADQPVWAQIAAEKPDYLVLLGDSIYLDIEPPLHPQEMDENAFAQHAFGLYQALLKQPQFLALVRQLPPGHVFSIWDDHDFLWNDALGGELRESPLQLPKINISTGLQRAFRVALEQGLAPGSFPDLYGDPQFWIGPPLETPSIALPDNTLLHLLDVRSYRSRKHKLDPTQCTLLGAAQRDTIETAIDSAPPGTLHLVASGSTLPDWAPYAADWQWLCGLAEKNHILVLSGDIHKNAVASYPLGDSGLRLHEATSSGAAVRDAVSLGSKQQNFGLLDIDGIHINLRLFHFGKEQMELARHYRRDTWNQPA